MERNTRKVIVMRIGIASSSTYLARAATNLAKCLSGKPHKVFSKKEDDQSTTEKISMISRPYSPSDLYVSGYSWDGQMGSIRTDIGPRYNCPERIEKFCLEPIKKVSLGLYHILVLSENGICYSWGGDYQNQLGHPTSMFQFPNLEGAVEQPDLVDGMGWEPDEKFVKMQAIFKGKSRFIEETQRFPSMPMGSIATIASGFFHNVAVTRRGNIWTWGSGWLGQEQEYSSCCPINITTTAFRDFVECRGVWAAGYYSIALISPRITKLMSIKQQQQQQGENDLMMGRKSDQTIENHLIRKYLLMKEEQENGSSNDNHHSAPKIHCDIENFGNGSSHEILNDGPNDQFFIWGLLPSNQKLFQKSTPTNDKNQNGRWNNIKKMLQHENERDEKRDSNDTNFFLSEYKKPSYVEGKAPIPVPISHLCTSALTGLKPLVHKICASPMSFSVYLTPPHRFAGIAGSNDEKLREIWIFGSFGPNETFTSFNENTHAELMSISAPFPALYPKIETFEKGPNWKIPISIFSQLYEDHYCRGCGQGKEMNERGMMKTASNKSSHIHDQKITKNSNSTTPITCKLFSSGPCFQTTQSNPKIVTATGEDNENDGWRVVGMKACHPNFYLVTFANQSIFVISGEEPLNNNDNNDKTIIWQSNLNANEGKICKDNQSIFITLLDVNTAEVKGKIKDIAVSLDSMSVIIIDDDEGDCNNNDGVGIWQSKVNITKDSDDENVVVKNNSNNINSSIYQRLLSGSLEFTFTSLKSASSRLEQQNQNLVSVTRVSGSPFNIVVETSNERPSSSSSSSSSINKASSMFIE